MKPALFLVALGWLAALSQGPAGAQEARGPIPLAPAPRETAQRQNEVPIETSSRGGAVQAGLGVDLCLDSFQGLPDINDPDGRPLILWRCHGRDNQRVVLRDGVLFIGAEQMHRIEPMRARAEDGCDERALASQQRSYRVGVCRDREAQTRLIADYADDAPARIVSMAPTGIAGPQIGTPLVVRGIVGGVAPPAVWEYLSRTRQLRVAGTDLCLAPPSQDLSEGAPLYLDSCAGPFRIDPRKRGDGVRRMRVRFDLYWR